MPVRSIFLAALLLVAAPAAAQQAIEARMTPEEFKAAGLDKLSAAELARLNAWLGLTIGNESAKAATAARAEAQPAAAAATMPVAAPRGPIQSRLQGSFAGFANGREYTLDNGQVWQQIDDARLPGVRLEQPAVHLNRAMIGDAWFLKVEGYNTRAKVKRIR